MTAHARVERCARCGTTHAIVTTNGHQLTGHTCTRRQTTITEPAPGVQVGRHLGALSSTSSQQTDPTGFCPGATL